MTGTTDEDSQMSPDDLAELFQQVFLEIFGGVSIKSLFRGLNARKIKRMPPFPFPKELFPPNTFPPGVRFSKKGLNGMPSEMIEALLGGGAGRAASSFFSQPHTQRNGNGDNDDNDDDDDDGWETVSEDDDEEEEGEEERKGDEEDGGEGSDDGQEEVSPDSDDDSDDDEPPPTSAPQDATHSTDPASGIDKHVVKQWFDAAKSCSVDTLSSLVSRHPSLLLLQGVGLGHTALHWLAARSDPGAVAWMLSLPGAQINIVNSMMKATPLHSAAGNGKEENVKLLLSRGADVTVRDVEGRSAAMVAEEHGHRELARLISNWKAAPHAPSPPAPAPSAPPVKPALAPTTPPAAPNPTSSSSSSTLSKEERAKRRAELLAEAEAAEREEDELEAVRAKAATRAAVASGVDPTEGRTFIEAVKDGDQLTMASMLALNPKLLVWKGEGTNFAFTGHTALHWAAARGHGQIVRWLIEVAGADPCSANASGSQPIHSACDNLQMDCVMALLILGGSNLSDLDGLGSSARDLMVARGATDPQLRRADLVAKASALIRADEGGDARPVIKALVDKEEGGGEILSDLIKKWGISQMRSFLVASGVSTSALPLEKKDLQLSCVSALQALLKSLPPPPSVKLPTPPSPQPEPLPTNRKDQETVLKEEGPSGAVAAAKAKGNKAFAAGQFKQAISCYSMAINICQGSSVETAVLFSNRSAANCKLSLFGCALEDADKAIALDPTNPKYWVRRGNALTGQGRIMWGEAREAYEEALRLHPGYEAAIQGLNDLQSTP